VTDLDRFLREVHRRRQAAEQKQAQERSPSPPVIVEPVQPLPPPFVPQSAEESRRAVARPGRRSQGPEEPEMIPTALPATSPTAVLTVSPMPVLAVLPALTRPVSPEVVPVGLPPVKAALPLKRELLNLLKSTDGLRTAVILQEVLGPPRSRHFGVGTMRGQVVS
jgi:hypothetical protein